MKRIVLVLALLAGGCAAQGDGPSQVAGPAVNPRWTSCADTGRPATPMIDDGNDALALPRLDDSFRPVSAVVCRTAPEQRPAGGTDLVSGEYRAGDIAALLAALRLPDEPLGGGACTLELPIVPWLALLDAEGRWIRPGVPRDSCGKARIEFRDAYARLETTRVGAEVVREVESDEAAAAGCSQSWADMVWATGRMAGGTSTAAPAALPEDRPEIRLCVYVVPPDERGTGKPGGRFESGTRLAPAEWLEVRRELVAAAGAPAARCGTPATRFAVLRLEATQVYVEADGCKRVLLPTGTGGGVLRQATPELGALLF